jgi:hypothetical protein
VSSSSSLLDIDGEDEDVPLLVPEQQQLGCRKRRIPMVVITVVRAFCTAVAEISIHAGSALG